MTPRNLDELMSIWAIGGRRDDASITASKPVEVETTHCNYFSCSLSHSFKDNIPTCERVVSVGVKYLETFRQIASSKLKEALVVY